MCKTAVKRMKNTARETERDVESQQIKKDAACGAVIVKVDPEPVP